MDKNIIELERDKIKAKNKNELKEVATICNYMGILYFERGQYDDALKQHQEELKLCKQIGDKLGQAIANRKVGECYAELERFDEALNKILQYLQLAQNLNNLVEIQRAWTTLGRTYFLQSNYDSNNDVLSKAEAAFKRALKCTESIKDKISERDLNEMICRANLNLALVYDSKDNNSCIKFYESAIFLARKYGFKEDLNRCLVSLGSFFQKNEKHTNALRMFDDAIKLAKEIKSKQYLCDALLCKGQTLLALSDYIGARNAFRKACFSRSSNVEDIMKAKRFCTLTRLVLKKIKQLNETNDINDKIAINDKLGDYFVSLKCFHTAIKYYKEELNFALKAHKSDDIIATIHVSIGQTYLDVKQAADALHHFSEEKKLRKGNKEEEIQSQLKIIEAKTLLDYCTEEIESHYENILLSIDKNIKLKKIVLNDYKSYLEQNNLKPSKQIELERNIYELNLSTNEEIILDNESESDEEDKKISGESELSEMSSASDSESDQEERLSGRGCRSNRRKKKLARNEKGETPLHVACIEGKLQQVKQLIDKGHPVNERDNCGWLPLHEACNHGFVNIAEYLIDHGANINDSGGSMCGGVTPLHDACTNGHLAIVKLLVRKGANVTALDHSGQTPMDCLMAYKRRSRDDDHSDIDYQETLIELQKAMNVVSFDFHTRKNSLKRSHEHTDTVLPVKNQSSSKNSMNRNAIALLENVDVEDDSNVSDYVTTISSIRRDGQDKRRKLNVQTEVDDNFVNSIPLVEEDKIILDDWLVDDDNNSQNEHVTRHSRKNNRNQLSNDTINKCKNKNNESSYRTKSTPNERTTKTVNDFILDDTEDIIEVNEMGLDDNHVNEQTVCEFNEVGNRKDYLNEKRNSSSSIGAAASNAFVNNNQSNNCKKIIAEVYIDKEKLLINISDVKSKIGWLSEEITKRFFEIKYLKANITLKTIEDALLSCNDCIDDLLIPEIKGDCLIYKVNAVINSYEMQALNELYIDYCKRLSIPPISSIENELKSVNDNGYVNLKRFFISKLQLRAFTNTIKNQEVINSIDLSLSNALMIDLNNELLLTILAIKNLNKLCLKNTGLTLNKLKIISNFNLPKLSELDLSYNHFTSKAKEYIVNIIRNNANLSKINLHSSNLNYEIFKRDENFNQIISSSSICEIIIENNSSVSSSEKQLINKFSNKCSITSIDFS